MVKASVGVILDPGLYCLRCYGGALYWSFQFSSLGDAPSPPFIHALFEQFAQEPRTSSQGLEEFRSVYKRASLREISDLEQAGKLTYKAEDMEPLPEEPFVATDLSVMCGVLYAGTYQSVYAGVPLTPRPPLTPGSLTDPDLLDAKVNGFSCHVIPLKLRADTQALVLGWSFAGLTPDGHDPVVGLYLGGTPDPNDRSKTEYSRVSRTRRASRSQRSKFAASPRFLMNENGPGKAALVIYRGSPRARAHLQPSVSTPMSSVRHTGHIALTIDDTGKTLADLVERGSSLSDRRTRREGRLLMCCDLIAFFKR